MAAIGIDLGTTNCCVAVERNGIIKVIPQSANTHTTPSYVSFWHDEILFGSTAKQRLHRNVENTVYDIKRLIGRNVSDVAVQSYINRWGFKVIEDEDDKLKVCIKFEGSVKKYTPEELSGLILKDLKSRAESFLDTEVTKAVITVPSYFNDAQRHATVDAGKIAGFEEVKLLNEPTAAAIAYSVENSSDKLRTIFVFDFGGGTFDVSVIKFKNNIIDVLAIDGNLQLGGNDIDNLLLNYVKNKYGLDIDKSNTKLFRLKHMCEDIKKQLSDAQDATMEIIEMCERDVDACITREEFNKLNDVIYQETVEVIERCLDRIKMKVKDIDDIILIGGSSKIRKLVEMLEKYFKKPLKRNINPDEAVAIGAAIVASSWGIESVYKELQFNDICPYSIGIEVEKGKMSVIIPRFTKLPASSTRSYYTSSDNQEIVRFTVVAGENYLAKNNFCVANLLITGFEVGPAHSVQFLTTFEIDKNGILTVAVLDCSTGTSKEFTVKLDKGRLSKAEIKDKVSLIDRIFRRKKK